MSKNSVVSVVLQLKGQQAQQALNQLNQHQKNSANELLRTNRNLEGVLRQQAIQTGIQAKQLQQLNTLTRQQASSLTQTAAQTNATLRTNQLLERMLQQQVRQSRLLGQNTKNQNRDYQLQVNMLRQQVAAAERLRQQLEAASRAQRGMGGGAPGGGVGGGMGFVGGAMGAWMAAKGVIGTPLERARSFETKIFDASTSVTGGYTGMNSQQVKNTNNKLSGYAREAVRLGHGTVDGVGDAAGILAASGLYKTVEDLRIPLLATAKTAFANGASEQDVALLTQQIKQFGIMPARTQVALDRATASGFNGGFELRDMARLLPEVLPYAKTAGYAGEEGLNAVTTHMQLARKYTGLPSQAADNMRDLYNLFSQNHFALAIGKYITPEKGDPIKKIGLRGNRTGFDIGTYLMNEKLEGVDTITAVVKLMNRQLSKDKRFVELQKQINAAEAEAKKTGNYSKSLALKIEAQDVVRASVFGKIFHNQQSLSGIMSIITGLNNGNYKSISEASWNGVGSVEHVAKFKGEIEPAKAHALEQETILATIRIYDSLKGTLSEFEGGLTDTMRANQALTASALAASGALMIVAGAGVGSKMFGARGAAGAGAAAAAGGIAARAGQFGLAGLLGYGVGTGIRNMYMNTSAGQTFDRGVGATAAHLWSVMPDWLGGDTAREAIAAMAKYDEMIEQQEQQSQQLEQQNKNSAEANKHLAVIANYVEKNGMQQVLDSWPGTQGANRHGTIPYK
jgi:hypothetical protein